jgi:ferredoxin
VARLICKRCWADTRSVVRCRACGALCPTSALGVALLSPAAFAFYALVAVVVLTLGLTRLRTQSLRLSQPRA